VKDESEEAVNPVVPKTVPLQVKLAESASKPAVLAKVTRPLVSPLFVTDVAVTEVNAPVFAVVAPTVPLMLIEAVPVRLVTTPEDGVPRAGVTKVGEVARTLLPVPVLVTLTTILLASSAKAVDAVKPVIVIPGTVVFVAVSKYTARSDGWVQITSLEPAEKLTRLPELLEDSTVVRLSVLPLDVYVPIPTSHSPNDKLEIA
jgi:hypothetical protein